MPRPLDEVGACLGVGGDAREVAAGEARDFPGRSACAPSGRGSAALRAPEAAGAGLPSVPDAPPWLWRGAYSGEVEWGRGSTPHRPHAGARN